MTSSASGAATNAAATGKSTSSVKKKRFQGMAMVASVLAVVILASYWGHQRATHVYSDDARIAASMIQVSAESAGQLVVFALKQGQPIAAGDLVAQIDDSEARFVLVELESELDASLTHSVKLLAQIEQLTLSTGGSLQAAQSKLQAALASQEARGYDLELKRSEWERAEALLERNIISAQSWESARNAEHQAAQRLQRAAADVANARAVVLEAQAAQSGLKVLAQERIALQHDQSRIRARIDRQQVVVSKLRITAPESGMLDKSFVEQGEYVVPGQRLALMHNPDRLWVAVNIKETDIRHIKRGTRAALQVDSYPGRTFAGEVFEIGGAATSQFSLLPSANPSGNFTKVTQRIPIKVSIEQEEGRLLPGMMVEVALEHD
jgi:membrane fusion protein (multidrug efflux system)